MIKVLTETYHFKTLKSYSIYRSCQTELIMFYFIHAVNFNFYLYITVTFSLVELYENHEVSDHSSKYLKYEFQ